MYFKAMALFQEVERLYFEKYTCRKRKNDVFIRWFKN